MSDSVNKGQNSVFRDFPNPENPSFWSYRFSALSMLYGTTFETRLGMAEGLAQLIWASKRFSLLKTDYTDGPERFWVTWANEQYSELERQKQAIKKYEEQTRKVDRDYHLIQRAHVSWSFNDIINEYLSVFFQINDRIRFNEATLVPSIAPSYKLDHIKKRVNQCFKSVMGR
ncbi:MAG: hypothetical protein ACK5W9_05035 [Bdellovibrionales bacterium]